MAFCQLQTALASIEKLYLTLSTSLLSDLRARGNGLLLAIHRLDTSGTLTAEDDLWRISVLVPEC